MTPKSPQTSARLPTRPTQIRYQVVALAVLLAMVTYLDRVCISKLAPDIMRDFGLSKIQMSYVFSAFDAAQLGFLSGLPLLLSVVSDLFGGFVSDRVAARFGLHAGRCVVGTTAYAIAAAALFVAASSRAPILAAVLISVSTAACMFTTAGAWGVCIEMGRNHAGVVSATMNTSGQIGSLLCPLVVGYSVEWFGNWDLPLHLMASLFLLGAVCWLVIDPRQPVFQAQAPPLD